ncbi:SgcJ/EcaC family oxidoreductase [Amycolatopsis regifaucium]|uniref:DUF4440 domain-containing protein n=1 Tax=Amycolatopsis regifaucium TaxID=546365 RepID=A0A154MUL8_9PSEU|nr:SgcJ/EcaC family oxidoreductase [Amycolatopsis regifaucium]KZB87437.1 DUF4440 domain-containing protein [Amycolatopsis regifaucium]OKA08276.1 DUF4440 domain-containing protein [Amycolatopsis regifaucium]SFI05282.1 conserved hypothetical protein [Amycolatopsis regifaucium]
MTTTERPTATPADQAAVAALPQRIVAAWGAHDADAFASVFTDDATMIITGVHVKGKKQIRDFMAGAFAGPYQGTQVVGTPFELRQVGPDTILLLTEGGVRSKTETEVKPENVIRASWLAVREDGEWRLAAYQNTPRD